VDIHHIYIRTRSNIHLTTKNRLYSCILCSPVEINDHGIAEQHYVNPQLLRMSEETGIELICTNDVHYDMMQMMLRHTIYCSVYRQERKLQMRTE